MVSRWHTSRLLIAMVLALGLAALLLSASPVLALETCYDSAGNPIDCPEKEGKPKPTPIPPRRTATPTATLTPSPTPTASPSPTPSPTYTPTPAAVLPVADPGNPGSTEGSSSPFSGVPRIFILLPAGLLLGLLIVLLASHGWSLQGVLKHEAPQGTGQSSSGKIPHKLFGIVDRSALDVDKLGKVKIKLPNLPEPPPTGGQHEVGHWQGAMGGEHEVGHWQGTMGGPSNNPAPGNPHEATHTAQTGGEGMENQNLSTPASSAGDTDSQPGSQGA